MNYKGEVPAKRRGLRQVHLAPRRANAKLLKTRLCWHYGITSGLAVIWNISAAQWVYCQIVSSRQTPDIPPGKFGRS
jgi:hypothetical protein